jgi:hypothetical protein
MRKRGSDGRLYTHCFNLVKYSSAYSLPPHLKHTSGTSPVHPQHEYLAELQFYKHP